MTTPPHIVLLGGGHANMLALLRLARAAKPRLWQRQQPPPYRITLISENPHTPYSGTLPGYIAGFYQQHECFIDLPAVAKHLRINLILQRAVAIEKNTVTLADGKHITFDALAVNCGAVHRPAFDTDNGKCIKPIGEFIRWLDSEKSNAKKTVIIGAGAGGVETAFAIARRKQTQLTLIGDTFLPGFPEKARSHIAQKLQQANIRHITATARRHTAAGILLSDGSTHPADAVIFATPAKAPLWLKNTDLTLNADGFITVNRHLQSVSSPRVFAAGDIAAHPDRPPKSGVMAVRQAPTLAHNLIRTAAALRTTNLTNTNADTTTTANAAALHTDTTETKSLRRWQKSPLPLYIISTADGSATANYRQTTLTAPWVHHWKTHLDTAFLKKFHFKN